MTSTFKRRLRGFRFEAEVDALALERILKPEEVQNARLIKIDIEGSEKGIWRRLRHC